MTLSLENVLVILSKPKEKNEVGISVHTTQSRIFLGTCHISWTTSTRFSHFINLSIDIVSSRSVITRVKLSKPFTILIFSQSTTNFICVRPQHGRIMSNCQTKSIRKIRTWNEYNHKRFNLKWTPP